ncbi:MAG TPA: hypothetical protein VFD80_01120 [Flavobacteriaceae bacterium]|nr:hypothetical protein [Flavobacteriaceae bacterium]
MTADGKIEVMVASSVIGYEDQVERVCGLFEQMGYHPISSHGSVKLTLSGPIFSCLN